MMQMRIDLDGKRCRLCGEWKPFDQFRRKSASKDGRQNECKPCSNARLDVWREKTRERRLAYNRVYYRSEHGRASTVAWKQRNPGKYKAQLEMIRALNSGELVKPDACESCGTVTRLDGHHADYSKPLDVMWLCRTCHKGWHRQHGEGRNANALS